MRSRSAVPAGQRPAGRGARGGRPRGRLRALGGAGLVLILALTVPSTQAAFSGTTANTGNTLGAAATFPNHQTSVKNSGPWAQYREEEGQSSATTPTVSDSSGNARNGTYDGVTDGPTTCWKFDENAGTNAADCSGAVNPGTTAGSPGWATGKVGSAVNLNGTTQVVSGARAAVDTSTSFSVSTWVYPTGGAGTFRTAVSQDGVKMSGFYLQCGTDNKWAVTLRRADDKDAVSDIAVGPACALNAWTHLVAVFDKPGNQIRLYVDGAAPVTAAHSSVWNATGPLVVGRGMWNGINVDYWMGRVDEVRTFQRVLTTSEIRTLSRGLPVVDWRFSEGVGTNFYDRGIGDFTGQFVNGATWTTAGKDGNGVTFNGVDGRATSLSADGLPVNTNTSFSASAWVNLTDATATRTAVSENGALISSFRLQYITGTNRFAFTMCNTDANAAPCSKALGNLAPSTSTWYHLAGVYDGTKLKLYVNGALQTSSPAFTSTWNGTSILAAGRGLYNNTVDEFWKGQIDSVRAYSYALTATEVTDLYNGQDYTEAEMTAGMTGALQGPQQGQQATTAMAFAGWSNAYSGTSLVNPTAFTVECWFRTRSTTGGVIMDFGDAKNGWSTAHDRMIYLDSGNKLTFGVYPAGAKTVRSTSTYNDGAWHHVAASLGTAGMRLYVDGSLVADDPATTAAQGFTGWWRWGGDMPPSSWPNPPATGNFTGTIDEVAVFDKQLTDNQILKHYLANH